MGGLKFGTSQHKSERKENCNKKIIFKVKDVYLHAFLKSNLNTQP
jgi:hypothetical protein